MIARPPSLDRALIRARLAGVAQTRVDDFSIGQRLMTEGNLESFSNDAQAAGARVHRHSPLPAAGAPPVPAAVLMPLIEHRDGFTVLLTQRTDTLKRHAGQVAFPGGRMDPEDADAVACALREAREETGIDPTQVEILGRLNSYVTGSGYEITPIVGAITPPLALTLDPTEVASAFEVPLAFILDAANHRRVERDFDGVRGAYYAVPFEDRYIWGATAAMLIGFYNALTADTATRAAG